MDEASRPGTGCVLRPPDRQVGPQTASIRSQKRGSLGVLTYCVSSGLVSATAGVLVGLETAGRARFIGWSAVVASVSVLAGLAYGSASLNSAWHRCRRLLHRESG